MQIYILSSVLLHIGRILKFVFPIFRMFFRAILREHTFLYTTNNPNKAFGDSAEKARHLFQIMSDVF